MRGTARTIRYGRTWLTGRSEVRVTEVEMERASGVVPARLLLPARTTRRGYPAWILLHGVTRPGFDHPQLVRFSTALATTGAAVIVPEVPEWKDLRLAPDVALPTVAGAIRVLRTIPEVTGDRFGLVGFSFGGPHALVTATHEEVAGDLAGVVSFGGYCDLERTVRFQFTGEHEWKGHVHRLRPDPYGRWIVGANYLTAAPGYGDAADVAQGLWELAGHAGDKGAPAWSAEYDELKRRLRGRIARSRRELFDVFAPSSSREPDVDAAESLVEPLTEGGRRVAPLMEPTPFLGRVGLTVELLHGRGDRLIPYTESARMKERLPAHASAHLTVTRLFAHSQQERFPLLRGIPEVWTFFRALNRMFGTV